MGPVRQNPIQRTVRSVHNVCASHCAQLLHTIHHRATRRERREVLNNLHVAFLFIPRRLDVGESSGPGLVQQRQRSGRRRSIAGPGRPLDGPRRLRRTVRTGPGDVQLARGDRRTHGTRHFHLVLHADRFDTSHTISSVCTHHRNINHRYYIARSLVYTQHTTHAGHIHSQPSCFQSTHSTCLLYTSPSPRD